MYVCRQRNSKKLWKEDTKWGHDKYDEMSMAPKSREELIAQYGFDIREEDGQEMVRGGRGGRGGRGNRGNGSR